MTTPEAKPGDPLRALVALLPFRVLGREIRRMADMVDAGGDGPARARELAARMVSLAEQLKRMAPGLAKGCDADIETLRRALALLEQPR